LSHVYIIDTEKPVLNITTIARNSLDKIVAHLHIQYNVVRLMVIFPLGGIDTRDKLIYYTNIDLGITEINQKLHLDALKWH